MYAARDLLIDLATEIPGVVQKMPKLALPKTICMVCVKVIQFKALIRSYHIKSYPGVENDAFSEAKAKSQAATS